jgi:hypothetical protein
VTNVTYQSGEARGPVVASARETMRKVLTPIAATAALLVAGSVGSPSAPAAPTAATACAHVKIGLTTTCLVAGRPCLRRYEKEYRRHGFQCRRNTAGQYRLWQVPIVSSPTGV